MKNPALIWSTVTVYLLFMVAMGIAFKRFNRNTADYFRGGSRGTWWLVGVSIMVTGISARSFTANAGSAYEAGFAVAVAYLGTIIGLAIQIWFLGPWMRQMRATTFAEVVRERFDVRTQQFYAYTSVVFFFTSAAIGLWTVGAFISSVFNYPIAPVIVAVGVVALIVSAVGGTMAVMASDVVQALLMLGMATVLTVLGLVEIGGIDGFMRRISAPEVRAVFTWTKPPGAFPSDQYTVGWFWALLIVTIVIHCSMTTAVRYFAVKDSREARHSSVLALVLYVLIIPVFLIPPWIARLLYQEQVASYTVLSKPAESAFAVASLELLPPSMIGLIVVAMLAVTMGSLDAGLNRNAALVINDMLPALSRRYGFRMPSARGQLRLAEVFTVISGVLCIWLAVHLSRHKGRGIFEFANDFTAMVALPMAVPLFWGIFWKRVPPWSALVSVLAGFVPSLWAYVDANFNQNFWPMQKSVWWVLGASTAGFFATMPAWKSSAPSYRARVDDFFRKMKTPVDFAAEVGEANDHRQATVIGWFCVAGGLGVFLLLPFVSGARETWSVTGLGLFVSVPGLVLLWMGRRGSATPSVLPAVARDSAARSEPR